MLASFKESLATDSVSIKTVDMIYKALENFIFISINKYDSKIGIL